MLGMKIYETVISNCDGCPNMEQKGFMPPKCKAKDRTLPYVDTYRTPYRITKIPDWCPLSDLKIVKESKLENNEG